MKTLILLSVVLPLCLTIEVKYYPVYGTAIKKVEIASCKAEPCALVKGTPLNITITVESRYPHDAQFDTVSDLESTVGQNGYRGLFVYPLARNELYCKQSLNECPLRFNTLYTIKRTLFLSKDDETTKGGFGSANGKHYPQLQVIMMAHGNTGTVIGEGSFLLDFKANQ